MWSYFRRRRRRKLAAVPLSHEQADWVRIHVPAVSRFDDRLRRKFDQHLKVLVAERVWEGCEGLEITDEMRYAISGHAAVMLLGTNDYVFDTVASILVFPDVIVRYRDGVLTKVVGEAWHGGSVVLSWPEVQFAAGDGDGRNVVIHEFAHHLDGLDGEMGGSIEFPDASDQARWDRLAADAYARLVRDVDAGRRTLLDPYGAVNRAEFFAVTSEAFFEQPVQLSRRNQELFELFVRYYAVDPRQWCAK